jgi:acylpyruvate hydrolase
VLCVGLNYRAHIAETGRDLPQYPTLFAKEVDGAVMQQSRTSDLLFGPAGIAAYASQAITLLPGDLLLTGTPGGVGNARKLPVHLPPGQTLRTVIEGLGECVNQCVVSG